MRAVWVVVILSAAAGADESDRLRGILYRMDADAHEARLHPDQSLGQAKAAGREALDAADRLDAVGRHRDAAVIRHEGIALSNAAQRQEPQDVQSHAIALEAVVRSVDENLPPHDIAH